MADEAERKILDMVEQGQITAEEGLRLMNAMGSGQASMANNVDSSAFNPETTQVLPQDILEPTHPAISVEEMQRMKRLKRWWVLPFGIGLVITTLGAIWMYMGYTSNGFGFGFWISWLPFLLGIAIVALSFQTSRSVWLHVRIKQKPGEKPQRINISLPLPLSLTHWFFSTFGEKIPGLKNQPVGDISEILKNLSPEEPFYVHVDEDDGEEVEVFIG
jgi:hypothetical protein